MLLVLLLGSYAQGQEDEPKQRKKEKKERAEKVKKPRKNPRDTSVVLAQPLRLEIPVNDLRDEFEIIDGFDDGLLVVQETNETAGDGQLWQFYMVNNDLEIEWNINRIISRGHLVAVDYSIGFYFLLFEMPGYRKYRAMVIDVKGENVLSHDFESPFPMEIRFFEALDNGILIVGQYNSRPVAMIYDLVGGKPQVLPGFYNNNEHVFDLVMDEPNRAFSVVLAERMRNGKYTNRIKTFTYDGLLVLESLIHPSEDLNLVDGTTTSFGSGIQYMVGTYSIKTSDFSRGLYISKFVNGQQRFIQEYNYGDLNNFFAYRGEKPARKMARKVARKKARGKSLRFNYKLFIHDVIQQGDLNIIVGEAYYAKYSNNSPRYFGGSSQFSPYGLQPGNQSLYPNFLGYKFTHAIIVAFNSQGDVVWDNSFKTNDITSYNLIESVATNIQGDRAIISYLDQNQIKSKVIEGNQVIEGKSYSPVRLLNPDDKLTSSDSETKGVRNWYDNYLYSFGMQRISNKAVKGEGRRRKVFYINKLEFDTPIESEETFRMTKRILSDPLYQFIADLQYSKSNPNLSFRSFSTGF